MIANTIKEGKANGFTIVELLIVIVVIGILAAVTLLTYRGLSEQTRNTSMSAGVKQYATTINAYYQLRDTYPKPPVSNHTQDSSCIGNRYSGNTCFVVIVGSTPYAWTTQQWFLDAMHQISPTLPPLPNDIHAFVGGNEWLGGAYYTWTGNTDATNNNSEYDTYGLPRADALIRFLLLGLHGTPGQQGGCGIPDAYVAYQAVNGVSSTADLTICQLNFEDGNPNTLY